MTRRRILGCSGDCEHMEVGLRPGEKALAKTNAPAGVVKGWANGTCGFQTTPCVIDEADRQIGRFISHANTYASQSHVTLGRCFRGHLAISRGDYENGLELLQASLTRLRAQRYELLTTSFNMSLVQALTVTGRFADDIALVGETVRWVEEHGD